MQIMHVFEQHLFDNVKAGKIRICVHDGYIVRQQYPKTNAITKVQSYTCKHIFMTNKKKTSQM